MSKLHRDNAGYVGCSYEDTQDPYYSYNKLSLPLAKNDKTVLYDEVTFTVTVAGGKFVINGTSQATVSLIEGNVYTFDQSDSSNSGHPLRFSYTQDGTHGDGQEYTLGVTTNGTPGTAGAYTKIVVPFGLHDLYYYCSVHSSYGGFADVSKDAGKFTTGLPILKTTDAFGQTVGTGNNEDPFAADLVFALALNGANNGTSFTDLSNVIRGSGSAKSVSTRDNVRTKTNQYKFYGSSTYFDGSGDKLIAGTSNHFIFDGDFTVEAWLRIDGTSSVTYPDGDKQIAGVWTGVNGDWQFNYAAGGAHNLLQFLVYDSNNGGAFTVNSGVNMNTYVDTWVHVAAQRRQGVIQIYVNGEPKGAPGAYPHQFGQSADVAIGGRVGANNRSVLGWLSDARIYNGVAKYGTPEPVGSYGMDAVVYGKQGASTTVNNLNFKPDLVWIKCMDNSTRNHRLYDCIRGVNNGLASNLASTALTTTDQLTSFNSDGFTVSNNDEVSSNNNEYIAWAWKAGGTPTTDNVAGAGNVPTAGSVKIDGANMTTALAGTIPATRLSANTQYGFSIVSYTGSGATGGTVGHGLSSAPKFIVIKNRDRSIVWVCYHSGIGSGSYLQLNSNAGKVDDATYWGSGISSTTFGLQANNASGINYLNEDHIAYCWSEVSGFSKFGSYTGTGASNAITTGFKPRWILFKRTSGVDNWFVYDTARDSTNPNNAVLRPNLSDAELASSVGIDFNADGFSMSTSDSAINQSGETYIYAAFAESAPGDAVFEGLVADQLDLKDQSGNGNNASNAGATWQTSVKKFYGGAADFSSSLVSVPNHEGFQIGSEDFSAECWVYADSSPTSSRGIMALWEHQQNRRSWTLQTFSNGEVRFYTSTDGTNTTNANASTSLPINQWVHLAITKQGSNMLLFKNGSLADSATINGSSTSIYTNTQDDVLIGTLVGGASTFGFDGKIQDCRFYKGIAKYTSSFSPPERSVQGTARRYPSGVYVVS